MASLFLNCAYNSNLRSDLMAPHHERPIETAEDIFARGERLWTAHFVQDASKPDDLDHFVYDNLRPNVQAYMAGTDGNLTTYRNGANWIMPDSVWNDIQENGAVIVLEMVMIYIASVTTR